LHSFCCELLLLPHTEIHQLNKLCVLKFNI